MKEWSDEAMGRYFFMGALLVRVGLAGVDGTQADADVGARVRSARVTGDFSAIPKDANLPATPAPQ